jgi:hypothetical protein
LNLPEKPRTCPQNLSPRWPSSVRRRVSAVLSSSTASRPALWVEPLAASAPRRASQPQLVLRWRGGGQNASSDP